MDALTDTKTEQRAWHDDKDCISLTVRKQWETVGIEIRDEFNSVGVHVIASPATSVRAELIP